MKNITTLILLILCTSFSLAQQIEKTYPLANSEKLSLKFEYPELVKVSTWDKQEVQIKAKVLINGQDGSDDFVITENRKSGQLTVSSKLNNLDAYKGNYVTHAGDMPKGESITVNRNGKTITVGNSTKTYYQGTEIEIELEVFLPKNAEVQIEAKYGIVEVLSAPKELDILAKFGGADVKVNESDLKSLWVSTSWGQVFSDLTSKMNIGGDDMLGKRMEVEIENSRGANSVKVESEFGNVFLRKQ